MYAYCRNSPISRTDANGASDESSTSDENGNLNLQNMLNFFGVDSESELPELPDNCMVFLESTYSYTFGGVTIVIGKTIVMDKDKYCVYEFWGISEGYSIVPYDHTVTGGYVYNVNEPEDYCGVFLGCLSNVVVDARGGAFAFNGVYAVTLGGESYTSISAGTSITYYCMVSDGWVYGEADIKWRKKKVQVKYDPSPLL